MSAAAILAGELSEARKRLKRCWNALSVAGLPIVSTDRVSGCIDRSVDMLTEAVRTLEAPADSAPPPVAASISTVAGQLDDARRAIRRAREALLVSAPYLDGYLDRAQDQASIAMRALSTDSEAGMCWYNSLTEAERVHWHRIADSAVPADCWEAFKADRKPKD